MDKYFIILISIPLAWMVLCLGYQLGHVIYLWMQGKWTDIKNKEYSLWD